MKRRIWRILAALTAAACLLAGCAAARAEKDGLALYYALPLESQQGGDAIGSVTVAWDELPQGDRLAQVQSVLALLFGSCQEPGFQSPIPDGTTLRAVELQGGTVSVDLSGSYGQLSGMDLTIADYCVALSLTQLEGVYAVRITVNGQELAYRDSNLFLAGDVLLTSMDDVVRTLTAQLYFFDADGMLTVEERLLTQYEGQSAADVVLTALREPPETEGLSPLLPEDLPGITARVEEGVCQLNVPAAAMEQLGDTGTRQQLLWGVVASLQSLDGVSSVQLYVDGTYEMTYE